MSKKTVQVLTCDGPNCKKRVEHEAKPTATGTSVISTDLWHTVKGPIGTAEKHYCSKLCLARGAAQDAGGSFTIFNLNAAAQMPESIFNGIAAQAMPKFWR